MHNTAGLCSHPPTRSPHGKHSPSSASKNPPPSAATSTPGNSSRPANCLVDRRLPVEHAMRVATAVDDQVHVAPVAASPAVPQLELKHPVAGPLWHRPPKHKLLRCNDRSADGWLSFDAQYCWTVQPPTDEIATREALAILGLKEPSTDQPLRPLRQVQAVPQTALVDRRLPVLASRRRTLADDRKAS